MAEHGARLNNQRQQRFGGQSGSAAGMQDCGGRRKPVLGTVRECLSLPAFNGLVMGVLHKTHYHLIIRPENVWCAILLTQLSPYMNKHVENLRGWFVTRPGQIKLTSIRVCERYTADKALFALQLGVLLQQNILHPEFRSWIMPDFFATIKTEDVLKKFKVFGEVAKPVVSLTQTNLDGSIYGHVDINNVPLASTEWYEDIVTSLHRAKTAGFKIDLRLQIFISRGIRSKNIAEVDNEMEQDLDLMPDALSLLTSRIEANLKKKTNGEFLQNKPRTNRKTGIETKEKGKVSGPYRRLKTAATSHGAERTVDTKATSGPRVQGKRRLRVGQLKDTSNGELPTNAITKTSSGHKDMPAEVSKLEQEILTLGGSKDDLELVQDQASESEIEGDASPPKDSASKGLKKALLRFVHDLGVDKVAQEVYEESESGQDKEGQNTRSKASETTPSETVAPRASKSGKAMTTFSGFPHLNVSSRQPQEIEPRPEWFTAVLPAIASQNTEVVALPSDLITRIHEYAKSLLDIENAHYASQNGSANSAQQFYTTIMSSGTLSDKISALTLSIQESPLHNMKTFDALVALARKRSRGQAVEVLGALKDMFGLGSVLPPDRKLRHFATQPDLSAAFMSQLRWTASDPLPKALTKAHLIFWAFEDWLKSVYFDILKILETWCNDEVVFARSKAIDYVCQLLKEKPEQEANLLRLLVNKLGDSDKKIASKTSYHILQLETAHPVMKSVIISAIESDLLFRPGQSLHAQYYATITLNQTVLSGKEEVVVKKLLDIYFSLFAKLLAKPDPSISAETSDPIKINQKGEIQGGGGPAGKAAKRKAAHKAKATTVEDDLREKMLSAILTGVNRAVPYTNTKDEPFEKHLDTLFRVTHSSNFNTSMQALMLIQQINDMQQGSADRYYRTLYESLLDPRLLTSSKQALYLNLLFKSLRSDFNVKRVKAFAKRLLQVVSMHQPSFACGAIYMLRELEAVFANFSTFVDDPEADDSEEEEAFGDVQETEFDLQIDNVPPDRETPPRPKTQPYDPRKRNPEHSNADRSSLWEILPVSIHYHPSVSLFATTLLNHRPLPPKPDLASHTLIHFLDRFVYRNPKATASARGASIMQPISSYTTNKTLLSSTSSFKARNNQPVNSESFWKMDKDHVGADEAFFHKYFSAIGKGKAQAKAKRDKKRKGKGKGEEDEGSEGEDEEEIWKALVESRPEIEGGESDDDLEMEDLEELNEEMGLISDDEVQDKGDGAGSGGDEGMPDFAVDDDDESLLGSEDDVPTNLQAAFEKEGKLAEGKGKEKNRERKEKRIKLKHLPTFASVEDYEDMLGGDDEGG
ncbi:MAG: hypothetical protein Q9224_002899 [Gallowayella concinna]